MNPCSSAPCFNGGTCTNNNGFFICNCVSGFSGVRCQTNTDNCLQNPCQNGGTCVDGLNTFTCQCRTGFSGNLCQNSNFCANNPCFNGATCQTLPTTYQCLCRAGFTGLQCQTNIQVVDTSLNFGLKHFRNIVRYEFWFHDVLNSCVFHQSIDKVVAEIHMKLIF